MSTFETVREMLVDQFQLDPAIVTPEAGLEELKIDSLSAIEFMFLLEEKFDVNAPMERIEIKSVGDIAREIDRLVAEQHGDSDRSEKPA
jgi:acyl carrier protein